MTHSRKHLFHCLEFSFFSWVLGVFVLTLVIGGVACGSEVGQELSEEISDFDRAERQGDLITEPRNPNGSASDSSEPESTNNRSVGQLRIARSEPITLDPALVTDVTSASYVVEIFGGLVSLDQDLNIVSDLAESIPDPIFNSNGSVSYHFVLRRDALFQNGRRVMADDVKWSLERNAAPGTFSPTAIDYLGDILGVKDYVRGKVKDIAGINVIDERTIELTIDSAKPYFLFKLSYPTAFIVDRTQIENDPNNWTRNPNGTGPFKLAKWQLGQEIILEPNSRYHLGAPSVASVQIRFAGGGLTQYENNEVDIAEVSSFDIERARDPSSNLNSEFVTRGTLAVNYLGFNVDQPPFDDPLVRRAFAKSIDKQTIIEVVLNGAAAQADGIVPPGIPGFSGDQNGLQFDDLEARSLLSKSRYFGSPLLNNIRITLPGSGATPPSVIEAIRQMWRTHLELEVEIQQVETATFFSELDRGLYQFFIVGWVLDYPDPENILDLLFHSRSLQNNTSYSDLTVDALLENARIEQDPEQRLATYREIEELIITDAPWVPLFFGQSNQVVKPYVKGYTPPRSVIPYLRYISLDE